uniref:Uncharacterized protein n=1 Tax=Branchiostoma floridae TaxID=7739 RepID=C3ZXP1_BRAFL|eukprot:XP_002586693.1 hypothetical protein BRAFLDRAFT_105499 [Branchiostoma floridae]
MGGFFTLSRGRESARCVFLMTTNNPLEYHEERQSCTNNVVILHTFINIKGKMEADLMTKQLSCILGYCILQPMHHNKRTQLQWPKTSMGVVDKAASFDIFISEKANKHTSACPAVMKVRT